MIRVSTQFKLNALGAAVSFVDMFADAVIRIYSGPIPGSANDTIQGTYLGYITRDGLSPAPGHGLHFDFSTSAIVTNQAGETWTLTGVDTGTAGWARLSAVTDPPEFLPSMPRVDFEVNPSDGIGFLMSSAAISNGMTRDIPYFNYSIPG